MEDKDKQSREDVRRARYDFIVAQYLGSAEEVPITKEVPEKRTRLEELEKRYAADAKSHWIQTQYLKPSKQDKK